MIIFLWIILSVVVGAMGSARNIGFFGALFCSLLFSPIIGLIIVLVSKDKQTDAVEKKILADRQMSDEIKKLNGKATQQDFELLIKARNAGLITESDYQERLKKLEANT